MWFIKKEKVTEISKELGLLTTYFFNERENVKKNIKEGKILTSYILKLQNSCLDLNNYILKHREQLLKDNSNLSNKQLDQLLKDINLSIDWCNKQLTIENKVNYTKDNFLIYNSKRVN